MKKTAFLLFLILSQGIALMSQTVWFESGAKWIYQKSAWTSGLDVLEYENQDTIINDLTYKILSHKGFYYLDTVIYENKYVYQDGNKVYSDIGLLYDFDATVGDTLDFMYFGSSSGSEVFIVDSIGTIVHDNQMLKFQDIKIIVPWDSTGIYETRLIETIGSYDWIFFFWSQTHIYYPDAPFYYFQCYHDINTANFNPPNASYDCGTVLNPTAVQTSEMKNNNIYPNPTSQLLHIELENETCNKIKIIDVNGKVIYSELVNTLKTFEMNLENISSGIYFLLGYDESGQLVLKEKVVKQNR